MTNIEWIFLDLGWTLVDETRAHRARLKGVCERVRKFGLSHSVDDLMRLCEQAATDFASSPFRDMLARLDLTEEERRAVASAVRYAKELEVLYPCVPEMLETLSRKFRLCVIANQSEGTEKRLSDWGIRDRFSVVLASAELGLSKPDPRIFGAAVSQCGVRTRRHIDGWRPARQRHRPCQISGMFDNACFAGVFTVSDAAASRRDSRFHDFVYQGTPWHPVCNATAAGTLRPGPALRIVMKIIGATCFSLRIPFVEAFGHSASVRSRSDSVVVRLTAEDGTVGYGEGLPRPYVTGETVETCVDRIANCLWPAIADSDFGALEPGPADTVRVLWSPVGSEHCPTATPAAWSRGTPPGPPVNWLCSTSCCVASQQSLGEILRPRRGSVTYSGVITSGGSIDNAVRLARVCVRNTGFRL